jgi:hypothetical protein
MWNIDLTQMHKYYEILVTIRGGHTWNGRETQNLKMVDMFSIQK